MSNKQFCKRCAIAWSLLLVLVFGALGAVANFTFSKHQWYTLQMESIEPRYARLKGLQPHLEDMQQTVDGLKKSIEQYVFISDLEPTQAGNDVLQRVRRVLEAAGFEVGSTQVLVDGTLAGHEKISLIIKGDANVVSLMASLSGLADLRPVVFVDSLLVQSTGFAQQYAPQRVAVQFSLSVIRSKR